jgi:hypothetical protein
MLENFAVQSAAFKPKSAADLFALRLAFNLGEPEVANSYVQLTTQYSISQMITAYRRAAVVKKKQGLAKRFHLELQKIHSNVANGNKCRLVAIRVDRRLIAAAVFYGQHLEYCDARQLPSDKDKVMGSAIRFATWLANQFSPDSVAIELILNGDEIQRQILTAAIIKALRDRLLPIWEIAKQDLFQAYGYPPLKCRRELREVIAEIWPILSGIKSEIFIQDAVAMGLYVQIERLFLH